MRIHRFPSDLVQRRERCSPGGERPVSGAQVCAGEPLADFWGHVWDASAWPFGRADDRWMPRRSSAGLGGGYQAYDPGIVRGLVSLRNVPLFFGGLLKLPWGIPVITTRGMQFPSVRLLRWLEWAKNMK